MRFQMPDACSMCLAPAADSWPLRKAIKRDEPYEGFQPLTANRGSEITRLNLSGDDPLMAPVCLNCRKRLKRYQWTRTAIAILLIVVGSFVVYIIESYIGYGLFALATSILAIKMKHFSNKPVLARLQLAPAEFREWKITDSEAKAMGCRVEKERLMVPGNNGLVNGDRIPVFANPEYQRRFNTENGIATGYGIQRQAGDDSLYGVGLNQLRK